MPRVPPDTKLMAEITCESGQDGHTLHLDYLGGLVAMEIDITNSPQIVVDADSLLKVLKYFRNSHKVRGE